MSIKKTLQKAGWYFSTSRRTSPGKKSYTYRASRLIIKRSQFSAADYGVQKWGVYNGGNYKNIQAGSSGVAVYR